MADDDKEKQGRGNGQKRKKNREEYLFQRRGKISRQLQGVAQFSRVQKKKIADLLEEQKLFFTNSDNINVISSFKIANIKKRFQKKKNFVM